MIEKWSRWLIFICLTLPLLSFKSNTGWFPGNELTGQLTFEGKVSGLPFANVVVYKGNDKVSGLQTDYDGFFSVNTLPPGTYTLEFTYVGVRKRIEILVGKDGLDLGRVSIKQMKPTFD